MKLILAVVGFVFLFLLNHQGNYFDYLARVEKEVKASQ